MPRLAKEYRRLSPTPDKFETFSTEIGQVWATQRRWSEADLARIRNPVAIADGDHEEMIFRTHTRQISSGQSILLRGHSGRTDQELDFGHGNQAGRAARAWAVRAASEGCSGISCCLR